MGFLWDSRRRRILRKSRLPDESWAGMVRAHPILRHLDQNELSRLRDLATMLIHEKTFEGSGGLELTHHKRTVIGVQASLPLLELGLEWTRNWNTIVVVPDEFVGDMEEVDEAGVVHEWEERMSGESWDRGPLVLSWRDVEASGWGDDYNVVIHEVAHKLDLLDGEMDGRPPLPPGSDAHLWDQAVDRAMKQVHLLDGKIDSYAGENPPELFAVTSEYFFENPRLLHRMLPEIYGLLSAFYRQDPVRRFSL